ncbi:hypothetical protein HK405_002264 [Cladochytrium tenue]|nr:hypothetical protein HK405_002264 [Cladochytrium tenue]
MKNFFAGSLSLQGVPALAPTTTTAIATSQAAAPPATAPTATAAAAAAAAAGDAGQRPRKTLVIPRPSEWSSDGRVARASLARLAAAGGALDVRVVDDEEDFRKYFAELVPPSSADGEDEDV